MARLRVSMNTVQAHPVARRGVAAIFIAVMLVPLIITVGVAIDMGRLSQAQSFLQSLMDATALAGASAYRTSSLQGSQRAIAAANGYYQAHATTNYFSGGTTPSIAAGNGTPVVLLPIPCGAGNNGNGKAVGNGACASGKAAAAAAAAAAGLVAPMSSLNVSGNIQGVMNTTFMSIIGINTLTLNATATAINPITQPRIMRGGSASSASDWNAVYMYAVPFDANGVPQYDQFPAFSTFYEIATDCNTTNPAWTPASQCNGKMGATIPATQAFPRITSTQPIAFLFTNMNNGQGTVLSAGYGKNQYGAASGNIEFMRTSDMATSGHPPTYSTDNTPAEMQSLTGLFALQSTTNYASVTNNCSVQIQVVDPANLPTSPPYPGVCLSSSDSRSGAMYANMSCSQLEGRTLMYWWNDMGNKNDGLTYKGINFAMNCLADTGNSTPNGGAITGTSVIPGLNMAVTLTQ